jgi:glutaredoxin-like protein
MTLLNDEVREQVTEMLSELPNPVQIALFTKAEDCDYCDVIEELLTEVSEVSEKVSLSVYDFDADTEKAAEYNLDKAPAIVLLGEKDYGLRFFGVPSNYEFSTLLHGLQLASLGTPMQLDEESKSFLAGLEAPIDYQVFVTPTCPYCPGAAVLAFEMAMESDKVTANVIEASEFQELAGKYNVMGVPLNVINDEQRVEGRVPPARIIEAIETSLA